MTFLWSDWHSIVKRKVPLGWWGWLSCKWNMDRGTYRASAFRPALWKCSRTFPSLGLQNFCIGHCPHWYQGSHSRWMWQFGGREEDPSADFLEQNSKTGLKFVLLSKHFRKAYLKFCKLPKTDRSPEEGSPVILGWYFCLKTRGGFLPEAPELIRSSEIQGWMHSLRCSACHNLCRHCFWFWVWVCTFELVYLNYQVDFLSIFSYFLYQFYILSILLVLSVHFDYFLSLSYFRIFLSFPPNYPHAPLQSIPYLWSPVIWFLSLSFRLF